MKIKKLLTVISLLFIMKSLGQNAHTEIETKNGIRFITTNIDYPITGNYLFKEDESIIELNSNGTGFYQLKEEPKRTMIWGIECDESGISKFIKGFDNSKYTLYYKYTNSLDPETEEDWNIVDFTIHFNSMKMYINGQGFKSFTAKEDKE